MFGGFRVWGEVRRFKGVGFGSVQLRDVSNLGV